MNQRVWTVAASLALLILGVFLRGELPRADSVAYKPFEYTLEAPYLGKVDDVRVTTSSVLNGVPSNAQWVVVDYWYTPETDLTVVFSEVMATDGSTHYKVDGPSCGPAYPGLRTECVIAFEMPEDKIAGAVMHLYTGIETMAPRLLVPFENPASAAEITREELQL